ncbi:hypothetical protein J6590_093215 [Homalodisca vitripennis]|nr:hypothetical protein J6590_093215 [Homalodisca vitripennis]
MTTIGKADLVGPWQFSSIPSGRLHRPLALCRNVARPIKSALGTQRSKGHIQCYQQFSSGEKQPPSLPNGHANPGTVWLGLPQNPASSGTTV